MLKNPKPTIRKMQLNIKFIKGFSVVEFLLMFSIQSKFLNVEKTKVNTKKNAVKH
jgi:hypothetical protein